MAANFLPPPLPLSGHSYSAATTFWPLFAVWAFWPLVASASAAVIAAPVRMFGSLFSLLVVTNLLLRSVFFLRHFLYRCSLLSLSFFPSWSLSRPSSVLVRPIRPYVHLLSSTVLCGWSLIGRLFWSPFWPRSVIWPLLAVRYLAIPAISVVVFVGSTSFGAVR